MIANLDQNDVKDEQISSCKSNNDEYTDRNNRNEDIVSKDGNEQSDQSNKTKCFQ